MRKKHLNLPLKNRTKKPCTGPATGLDVLLLKGIINDDMKEAAETYAAICHKKPAGGPHISRMTEGIYQPRHGHPPQRSLPDHLEGLWRKMHTVLQPSPIRDLVDKLIQEDDPYPLEIIIRHPKIRVLLREALESLIFCLRDGVPKL